MFLSWDEFKKGKWKKLDVQKFALNIEDNIFRLRYELKNNLYQHSDYISFCICDPKLRRINKASVKDRIVHHAIMRVVEPYFDKLFIFDSYSSRKNKGTHRAIKRFKKFAWKLSCNNTKTVWVLKCDIKKFFDSVNHDILLTLIKKRIDDKQAIKLIKNIIHSFNSSHLECVIPSDACGGLTFAGLPLGNLTSQLFSNIYLNELDQFIKRNLHVKYYLRYADDFVILSRDKLYLQNILIQIDKFLNTKLNLRLHERKVSIKRWHKGTDFLGYVIFPHHYILRTKTKKRMLKKIKIKQQEVIKGIISEDNLSQTLQAYLGILGYCCAQKIKSNIKKDVLKKR